METRLSELSEEKIDQRETITDKAGQKEVKRETEQRKTNQRKTNQRGTGQDAEQSVVKQREEPENGDRGHQLAYQKKSYKLFMAWMAFFIVVLYVSAVKEISFWGLGAIRSNCIVIYVTLDVLMLLIYWRQSIYWINGVTYEEAAAASADERRRYAFRHLRVFLAATVLYICYCCLPASVISLGGIGDSIVAGGILCAAAILTIPIHL